MLVGDNLALAVAVRISGRVTADTLLAMDRITSTYSGMILQSILNSLDLNYLQISTVTKGRTGCSIMPELLVVKVSKGGSVTLPGGLKT